MLVELNGKRVNLPDFFLIGAGKSGTTSLAKYISQHPQIYIPEEKELHYFLFAENPPIYYDRHIMGPVLIYNLEDYLTYFQNAKAKICGDCSVSYMYSEGYKQVIKNIKRIYPNQSWMKLKFIAILRNPIERAFSQYITRLVDEEDKPFVKACFSWEERKRKGWSIAYDYLGFSFYYKPIKAYIEEFGKENVKIYLYEDLKGKPKWVIKDIFEFLGVDSSFTPQNLGKHYNVSAVPKSKAHDLFYKLFVKYNPIKYPLKAILSENIKDNLRKNVRKVFMKKPQLTKEEREMLKPIFREDILKLQDLIGRDLSHWLEE
ncbi:sulfotransferase family protein [Persephonella sp.]